MVQNYYTLLQDQVKNYNGDIEEVLDIPNFFRVLSDLLSREIDSEDRKYVCAALAYLVAPKDAVPEEIYGSAGYEDDLFLCAFVLNSIRKKHSLEIMENLWRGEEGTLDVSITSALEKSEKQMEAKKFKKSIFEYVGL